MKIVAIFVILERVASILRCFSALLEAELYFRFEDILAKGFIKDCEV